MELIDASYDDSEIPIPINNELDQRIYDVFMTYDHSGNKTVDGNALGTIIRALGLIPNKADVDVIVQQTQTEKRGGLIHLVDFLPYMAKEIMDEKYKPNNAQEILDAFRALDAPNHGYLNVEDLRRYMQTMGERFDDDEMEEMLEGAYNPFQKRINYEHFVNKLLYRKKEEKDVFELAEAIKETMKVPLKVRRSRMFSGIDLKM